MWSLEECELRFVHSEGVFLLDGARCTLRERELVRCDTGANSLYSTGYQRVMGSLAFSGHRLEIACTATHVLSIVLLIDMYLSTRSPLLADNCQIRRSRGCSAELMQRPT